MAKFFLLLLCLTTLPLTANTLPERLTAAGRDAEQISNHLLSLPADTLTTEDWLVLTEAQRRLRNKEAAMDAVNRALQNSRQPYLQAYGYLLKAQVYGILYRDTAIAITQLDKAEQLLQQTEDSASLTLYSEILQSFAQAYNQLGDISKAIPYAEKSLTLAVRLQQAQAELDARIILGRLTLQNNAYGQAYQHLQQALTLASSLQDKAALASIHFRLGMAYRKIGDHVQALTHLQQARQLYLELNNASSYVYTLIYIAETYLEDITTAEQAAQYLNEALELATTQEDLLRVGMVKLGLGRLAILQEQPTQALRYFNESIQLFRQQNVQTYVQEANMALAELQLQQGAPLQAAKLLAEHQEQMSQAASYLRFRYHDLSARIDAALSHWQDAYTHLELAGSLKFAELTEQSALQLDMLNNALTSASTDHKLQQQLQQLSADQLQQKQQLWLSQLAAATLLILTISFAILWWRNKRQLQLARPGLSEWQQFCQRLQHKGGAAPWLVAITTPMSQQLKRRYGEQRLQLALQHSLQQAKQHDVIARCLDDDVLWLGVHTNSSDIAAIQAALVSEVSLLLSRVNPGVPLFSLALPVTELLGANWHSGDISALREALWLSQACCEREQQNQHQLLLSLRSNKANACEWRSNLVRQDLLSALQLGDLSLWCNGKQLPPSGFETVL